MRFGDGFRLAALGATTTASAQDLVNLRLNWYFGGTHVAFYLGRDRGYFTEQNIDIQIDEGRGSGRSVQLVGTGTDDFAMADAGSLMVGVSKGPEAVSIMSLVNISTFAIVALEGSGIASPKDLEGKTVAVTAGDALTQLWPAVIAANDLDADAINLVMMDPAAKPISVMEGRTDALLGGISDQPNLMRKHGHEVTPRSQIVETIDIIQRGLVKGQPFGYNPPEVWQQTLDIMKDYRGLETNLPATAF